MHPANTARQRIAAPLAILAAALILTPARGQQFEETFESIKRHATPAELYAFLYQLPKGGDLHHHLGLSFMAEDLWDVAVNPALNKGNTFFTRLRVSACPQQDSTPALRFVNIQRTFYERLNACEKSDYTPLGSLTAEQRVQWLSALRLDKPGEGRNEFFEAAVFRTSGIVRNIEVLDEQIKRMLTRLGRENIRYIESQMGLAGFVDNDGNSQSRAQVADRLRKTLASSEAKASGIAVRFQAVAIRFSPQAEKLVEQAYEAVARNRDIFVGVNMAGREDNDKGHPGRFLQTFRNMRRKYSDVHLSIHAGEKDSPGHEVRDTLLLGAERIGHGFNLITDPETMLLMRNGQNLVEVSLVSNHLLEYAPDLSSHPFIEYLRFGIPVCLNTDDSGSWDSQLTDEYFLAIRHFDLTWGEVVELGRNSLRYAFLDEQEKSRLLANYEAAIRAFEARHAEDRWRANLAPGQPGAQTTVSGYARRHLGIQPVRRENAPAAEPNHN